MKIKKIGDVLVNEEVSIKETMRTIDATGLGTAIIVDKFDKLKGLVTDGDIRRAIMEGTDIKSKISLIMNKNPLKTKEGMGRERILNEIKKNPKYLHYYNLSIPIVNKENKVVDTFIRSGHNIGFKVLQKIENVPKPVEKVLIVGGAGYLGSVLCRKLLDKGYKIKVLDILMFGEEPILELKNNPNLEFIHGDIRNVETITKTLTDVDAVIHLAAIVGDPASRDLPTNTIETNYLATMSIAQACKYHQINRFIFASTCSTYGKGNIILDETASLNPVSLYARSKIESEKGILSLTDENFAPTSLRMATLHGLSPRMRFDLVVNIFAMMSLTEKKIHVFGGNQWRPLLHVEDAAEAFIKCLQAPIEKIKGEVFNVGSNNENYQINQLGNIVKSILPETKIEVSGKETIDGQEDERDYKISFEKIEKIINFKAEKTVEQSIKEIQEAIINGKITDVKNPKYYNSR